jgi:chromosomal replication initiation ATPase DnaA
MNDLHKIPVADLVQALHSHPELRGRLSEAVKFSTVRDLAANVFQVTPESLTAATRRAPIAKARLAAMMALHDLGLSHPSVARFFRRRHHSSVIYACRRVPILCASCTDYAATVQRLRNSLALPPILSQTSVKSPVLA